MRATRDAAHDLGDLAEDLPVIDLTAASDAMAQTDPVAFEEAYAQLAFGLGIVPRRRHDPEPLWRQPVFLLIIVAACIILLLASI
jgi:hypothetical protein